MKWITALDLQNWAKTIAARQSLPALVGDLIRASATEIRAFRFPSGDKGQVRGFDGWLEATGVPPYVPDGLSIWEFGVAGEKPAKALSDYNKRIDQVEDQKRALTTFVFVSPETWNNGYEKIQDWVQDRKDEKKWRDVLYIDGVQLEDWLLQRPAVAAHYAREEMGLKPQVGARGVEEFWDEYSHRFKTRLTEEVLLAGRDTQATALLQRLIDSPGGVELAADSPDEVIAFAIAAVRKADTLTRLFLESRIVIVDSEDAARFFSKCSNLIFFPRAQANQLSGLLSTLGPTLLAKGRDQPLNKQATLPSPSTSDFGKALETMGLDRDAAYGLAREAGRSITILSRRYPGGTSSSPAWMAKGIELLPAMLAGGWDGSNAADQEMLSKMTPGGDYQKLERELRQLSRSQDPPVDLAGEVWTVRAPVDLFIHIGHLVGAAELDGLELVATEVFSQIDSPPHPDDPFVALSKRPARHSGLLRDGIANTLLQMSVLNKQADLKIPGIDPERWVENLVNNLPGLKDNSRLIVSLRDQLWLLMEAAPRPLLEALERLLEGNGEGAKDLFSTDDGMFAPSSPHIYVLWALESLAWDPAYLERTAHILAKFSAIDPGGQTSNRPINSLRSILLSWSPNTHAGIGQRNSVLDMLTESYPDVGWQLLLALLPKAHDISSPTRKPRFREAGASNAETLTNRLVWEAQAFVIERVLQLPGNDETRWVSIVDAMDNWPRDLQRKAVVLIDNWLTSRQSSSKIVWQALNDLANKHLAFSDAEWVFPPETIQEILAIARKHQPSDVVAKVCWLFDSWYPQVPGEFDVEQDLLKSMRSDALTEVLSNKGTEGVFELLGAAKELGVVAVAVSENTADVQTLVEYVRLALSLRTDRARAFARIVSAKSYDRFGLKWREALEIARGQEQWTNQDLVALMLNWPDERNVWEYVALQGHQILELYWHLKPAFALKGSTDELAEAINSYIEAGRPSAAITASHRRLTEIKTSSIIRMLEHYIPELNASEDSVDQMSGYYVGELFKELDKRTDIEAGQLAHLEYAYFPMLDRHKTGLTIYRLMSEDPQFYISLISSVFRSNSESGKEQVEEANPNEKLKAKWKLDYRLLSQFETVPGASSDGVNFDELVKWVTEVRRLGREADRAEITDVYVGHLLAHAPADDDGGWPHVSVRRLLQEVKSDDMESGIQTERFNMRGVYSKSLYEGGRQERELAETYRKWAKLAAGSYHRASQLLERIALAWASDAEREDRRADLDKLRG